MRQILLKLSRAIFHWPPLPASVQEKQSLIIRFGCQRGLKNFIETGTFQGDMVEAQRTNFHKLVTIELGDALYEAAKRRFAGHTHVQVLHGDSGALLPEAIRLTEGPALYWLDAHYSRGITAGGDREAPILKELSIIAEQGQPGDAILIDDARLFGMRLGYPRLATVRKFAARKWPAHSFRVESDVICILPP